ncbi:PAS domain-containing protein [Sulfurimonas sp.]|nr:PAS domain-containing protein [Sulfurimonas sp.]
MNEEISFDANKFIISKTDLKGKITYCNELFIEISGYEETELITAPHSILRHPDMPQTVFKLLWNHIQDGKEIFAYVKNLNKQGKYYWVLAFVTPSYDAQGKLFEYFSVRRKPKSQEIIAGIDSLYKTLLSAERSGGVSAGEAKLNEILTQKGMNYEEFIFSL